jgi:uncharacterized RDD family membrane protein YckC
MQIYLARNNQQAGPYTLDQVNAMLANTQVVLTDLAWHEGMTTWLPLGQLTAGKMVYIPNLKASIGIAPIGVATQPGSVRYTEASINPTKVLANGTTLASPGQRIGAALIDLLTLFILLQIVFASTISAKTLVALNSKTTAVVDAMSSGKGDAAALIRDFWSAMPAPTLYAVISTVFIVTLIQVLLIARRGQTLGKILLKIKIVDEVTLEKSSFYRSVLLRSVLVKYIGYSIKYISTILFLADLIFLFSTKNQTLHDRLAKTLVIKVGPTTGDKPKF